MNKPLIVIVVEKGVVREVYCSQRHAGVYVIDLDTPDAAEERERKDDLVRVLERVNAGTMFQVG